MSEVMKKEKEFELPAPALSYHVFHWPEFNALADRLGIPHEVRTQGLTIRLGGIDELVKITHEYSGADITQPKTKKKYQTIETTTLHNHELKTEVEHPLASYIPPNPIETVE